MKKIIKLILCLGLIPFLCSLTNEQKFKIVSRIVIPTAIPIQNLQCRDYDLKTLEYSVSPYGYGMEYLPVCDHLDRGECIIRENGKCVGLNPQCDSIFMFTEIYASRQDTTYDAFIFFKGPKYYVVLYPCFVLKGEEAYTIGDIEIARNDSIGCDSCVTVYLDETVPFRTDTCTSMPTYSQTHILSKRTVLRICESDMYEKMDPDSLPADHCLGIFDDSEVDDVYVDYVDVRPEFCQGQQEEKTNWWYDELTFSVSDTMVTISSQIDMGLSRWHSKHENWAEAETDSIFPTLQKMLDSIASFAKRDPNCSYVITRYGTSYWKWGNRRLSMNRAELLKDYLVWCGVDSSSIWITLDTIPNCQPLEYSKNCLHYYEIKKVGIRQYSGWIQIERKKCLPNAYLYGVMKNCFHRQLVKEIGRSDKDGRFVCDDFDATRKYLEDCNAFKDGDGYILRF